MNELVLTLREPPPERLDASPLAPDRLAGQSVAAIERLRLRLESGATIATGDLFTIVGPATDTVRIEGDLSTFDRLGAETSRGTLLIDGSAGHRLGWRASGGRIRVAGHAGDGVGLEMSGGTIVVQGSVGRRTGSAVPGSKRGMTGGEIVVFGEAGAETGACLRRGVIAVAGRIGPDAARSAIAGTVLAGDGFDAPAGRWLKRASLVSLGEVAIPPAFRESCTFRPPFVAVLLTHLRRTYDFPVSPEQTHGFYRQVRGDLAELGRGEILTWTGT